MLRTVVTHLKMTLALAAVAAVTGCVEIEQRVLLNGDGSLAVRTRYSLATESEGLLAAGAQTIRGWQGRTAADEAWFTSEATVRQHFAGTGVTVQSYGSSESRGRRQVELQVFAERGVAVLNAGILGPLRCDRRPDGRLRVWAELPAVAARAPGLDETALKALCQDLRLRLEVCVPGEIVETTAPKRARGEASWEFDPAKDASFLRAPPRIECVFEAKRLDWAASVPAAAP